jgi:O-antigen/teichoic acid export membrane protein
MSIIQLLSDLPFNPSLINRVGGYSKQLERELRWRQLGVVLLIATLVVQMVAFLTVSHLWSLGGAIFLGLITVGSLVFYCRARLIRKELSIIRKEYGKEA